MDKLSVFFMYNNASLFLRYTSQLRKLTFLALAALVVVVHPTTASPEELLTSTVTVDTVGMSDENAVEEAKAQIVAQSIGRVPALVEGRERLYNGELLEDIQTIAFAQVDVIVLSEMFDREANTLTLKGRAQIDIDATINRLNTTAQNKEMRRALDDAYQLIDSLRDDSVDKLERMRAMTALKIAQSAVAREQASEVTTLSKADRAKLFASREKEFHALTGLILENFAATATLSISVENAELTPNERFYHYPVKVNGDEELLSEALLEAGELFDAEDAVLYADSYSLCAVSPYGVHRVWTVEEIVEAGLREFDVPHAGPFDDGVTATKEALENIHLRACVTG